MPTITLPYLAAHRGFSIIFALCFNTRSVNKSQIVAKIKAPTSVKWKPTRERFTQLRHTKSNALMRSVSCVYVHLLIVVCNSLCQDIHNWQLIRVDCSIVFFSLLIVLCTRCVVKGFYEFEVCVQFLLQCFNVCATARRAPLHWETTKSTLRSVSFPHTESIARAQTPHVTNAHTHTLTHSTHSHKHNIHAHK